MIAVKTEQLRLTYKGRDKKSEVVALEGLSIEINQGEVYGLLGPNGAGKTTLVKVLSTILLPTAGSASIMGLDVEREFKAVRRLIGIVFGGDRGLYPWISGRDNLDYWAALYKVPAAIARKRIAELVERVGLADRIDDRVETYSRGMKQRLHLARGLVAGARVLFLDEPTTGMDPIAARDFRSLVKELQAEGTTILITTHDMAEAEAVCDRVALIDHGQLVAMETPATLGLLVAEHERIDFRCPNADVAEHIRVLPGVGSVEVRPGDSYRVQMTDSSSIPMVVSLLAEAGVTSINTSRPSLEEVYVHLIGDRGLKV